MLHRSHIRIGRGGLLGAGIIFALAGALMPGARADDAGAGAKEIDDLIARVLPAGADFQPDKDGHWTDDPGALALNRALLDGKVTDAQWATLLEKSGIVTMRDKWPVDMDLTVRLEYPTWAGPAGFVSVKPHLIGGEAIQLSSLRKGPPDEVYARRAERTAVIVGRPLEGPQDLGFDVEVWLRETTPKAGAPSKPIVRKGTIVKHLVVAGGPSDVMTPVNTPDVAKAIRASLTCMGPSQDQQSGDFTVVASLTPECKALAAQMSMPIEVEVVDYEGSVQKRFDINLNDDGLMHGVPITKSEEIPFVMPDANQAKTWIIRVHGNIDTALQDVRFASYWDGVYGVPFGEVFKPGK